MALPNAQEQELLELINRFRANPIGEFDALISSITPRIGVTAEITNAINYFNVDLALFRQQLHDLANAPPLAWNVALEDAAALHSALMIQHDRQAHQLPGEPDLGTRLRNAGYELRRAGENIYAYASSVVFGHAGFIIDWGFGMGGMQVPPGHRLNLIDPLFTEIGVDVTTELDSRTAVGPLVITQEIGTRFDYMPQLLGVVYRDGDGDRFYDAGEGSGGVTVTASGPSGTFATTTWSSGGYQLGLPAGSYAVTFSGGTLRGPYDTSVTVGTTNQKLDNAESALSAITPTVFAVAPGHAMQLFPFAHRDIAERSDIALVHQGVAMALPAGDGFAFLDADMVGDFAPGNATYRDINGDGRMDVTLQTDSHVFHFAAGSGSGATGGLSAPTIGLIHGGPPGYIRDQVRFADANADGRFDAIFQGLDNRFWINFGADQGYTGARLAAEHGGPFNPEQVHYADINGDHRADLIFHGIDNRFWVNPGTNDGFTGARLVAEHGGPFNPAQVQFADVSGDGRADLCFQGIDNRFWLSFGTGDGFGAPVLAAAHGGPFIAGQAQYADINADGRADLIMLGADNRIWASVSNGAHFGPASLAATISGDPLAPDRVRFFDMNDDGAADLMYQTMTNGILQFLSTGTGFGPERLVVNHRGTREATSVGYGDVNGDRLGDVVFQDAENNFWVSLQGHDWLP
jgi:hypothetical protein